MYDYLSFKDLKVWKSCSKVTQEVFRLFNELPEGNKLLLAEKILTTALEMPVGIAVGKRMWTDDENYKQLTYAWKELNKLESLLYLAQDLHTADKKQLGVVFSCLEDARRLLSGYRKYYGEKLKARRSKLRSDVKLGS